jgi:hypothetical protein
LVDLIQIGAGVECTDRPAYQVLANDGIFESQLVDAVPKFAWQFLERECVCFIVEDAEEILVSSRGRFQRIEGCWRPRGSLTWFAHIIGVDSELGT